MDVLYPNVSCQIFWAKQNQPWSHFYNIYNLENIGFQPVRSSPVETHRLEADAPRIYTLIKKNGHLIFSQPYYRLTA